MRKSLVTTRKAFFMAVLIGVFLLPIISWAATLSASPSNVAQGSTVTATWGAISAPTNGDWIGFYQQGVGDGSYRDWIYVSCTKSMGGASVNGSCSFGIPGSLPNGTYELRLFANDGFTRLATSNPFNVAPLPPPRFVDNRDGSVTDIQTGLMWARKTGIWDSGATVSCVTLLDCPDPHNVNNAYTWSSSGVAADGPLFTDFLERVNGNLCNSINCRGLAGHTDWRIPTIAELQTIFCGGCDFNPQGLPPPSAPRCGQQHSIPCIQTPLLVPSSGMPITYWTSSTLASNLSLAFVVNFRIDALSPTLVCDQPPTMPIQLRECFGKGARHAAFAVRGGF